MRTRFAVLAAAFVAACALEPAKPPPAEIPLAAVLLEWEAETDALYAVGIGGRPVFTEFFKSFPKNVRREVQEVTPVWELERYSRAVLSC